MSLDPALRYFAPRTPKLTFPVALIETHAMQVPRHLTDQLEEQIIWRTLLICSGLVIPKAQASSNWGNIMLLFANYIPMTIPMTIVFWQFSVSAGYAAMRKTNFPWDRSGIA